MYFVRTPYIIKKLYPEIIWNKPSAGNTIYLTFDDGPHPEITPWITDQLERFHVKATFFCLGQHAEKFPGIIHQLKEKGHPIGNHSFSHLNGWKTQNEEYFKDIKKADQIINSKLFRPPYGKLKRSQYSILSTQYSIFNFSLMPGDFDISISSARCLDRLKTVRPGDIICLHDNEKSWPHLSKILPAWMEFITSLQFNTATLPD